MSRLSASLQRSEAAVSGLFFGCFEKCVVAERTADSCCLSQTHFELCGFPRLFEKLGSKPCR